MRIKKQKPVILSLVGTTTASNVWVEKFRKDGYRIYSIRDLLMMELHRTVISNYQSNYLQIEQDESSHQYESFIKWLGSPGDPQYEKNSKIYLKVEDKITNNVIAATKKTKENCLICTGSNLQQMDKKTVRRLKDESKLINLIPSISQVLEMYDEYVRNPGLIVWQTDCRPHISDSSKPLDHKEIRIEIESILKSHRELADLIVDEENQKKITEVTDFINFINKL